MKQYLLTLLCLLTLSLQAAPVELTEPVGQRFGMSLLEVLDSVYKEGVYHYVGSSGKQSAPGGRVSVDFRDSQGGGRLLSYNFVDDKCTLAFLMLPLEELDATVQEYDRKFSSPSKQVWRTPYGTVKVTVVMGAESMRKDHKPHLFIIFDPSL